MRAHATSKRPILPASLASNGAGSASCFCSQRQAPRSQADSRASGILVLDAAAWESPEVSRFFKLLIRNRRMSLLLQPFKSLHTCVHFAILMLAVHATVVVLIISITLLWWFGNRSPSVWVRRPRKRIGERPRARDSQPLPKIFHRDGKMPVALAYLAYLA